MISFDASKCIRCGRCIADCIVQVIQRGEDGLPFLPKLLAKHCMKCQHCLAVCPSGALTCDGHEVFNVREADVITVRPASDRALFVRNPRRSFIEVLRDKLSWAGGFNA